MDGYRVLAMAGALMAGMVYPVAAQAPRMPLLALDQLETGLWQLDVKGKPPRQICMTDPMVFIQLEHTAPSCSRFVIQNDPRTATVHYSCNAAGWGRTTVHLDTARVAQIDTQGILGKAPFQYSVEARKIGPCPTLVTSGSK